MRRQMKVSECVRQVIRRDVGWMILFAAVIAGALAMTLLPPLVLEKIVDALAAGQAVTMALILEYVGFQALSGVLDSLRDGMITVAGQKVTRQIRSQMAEKLCRLKTEYFTEHEAGQIVSRFVSDVDTVEQLFTEGIISMVVDAVRLIGILWVVYALSAGLGIVLSVVLPLLYAWTRHVQKNMLKAERRKREAVAKVSGHVPETIRSIRMIHTFFAEKFMEEKYDRYIEESYQATDRTNYYNSIYSPVVLITNAAVIAFVMIMAAQGNPLFAVSVGTAVALISYINKVFSPIESIGMEIQTIQSAAAGVQRINEFFRQDEREEEKAQHEDPEAPAIAFDDVTFSYGEDEPVFAHRSLQVLDGDRAALAGRTGCGKSTMFKLILGLYRPQKGTVRVQGMDPVLLEEKSRRKLIGYVPQEFRMVEGTVLDQITLKDPEVSREDAQKACALAGLDETIRSFPQGYDTPCRRELFSKGQWQLLGIARAAASDPRILLLDEVTANLDSRTEKMILDAVTKASQGRTVFSIAHRLFADQGRIIRVD